MSVSVAREINKTANIRHVASDSADTPDQWIEQSFGNQVEYLSGLFLRYCEGAEMWNYALFNIRLSEDGECCARIEIRKTPHCIERVGMRRPRRVASRGRLQVADVKWRNSLKDS